MERAQKGDHVLPLRAVARQFECGLNGFRPRVRKENLLGRRAGSQFAQFFHQLRHRFVVEVAAADMQELARLLLYRLNYFGMGVAGSGHSDPGGEIQEEISIYILDHHPFPLFDHQRINPAISLSGVALVPLDNFPGPRAWRRNFDRWDFHNLGRDGLSALPERGHFNRLQAGCWTEQHRETEGSASEAADVETKRFGLSRDPSAAAESAFPEGLNQASPGRVAAEGRGARGAPRPTDLFHIVDLRFLQSA